MSGQVEEFDWNFLVKVKKYSQNRNYIRIFFNVDETIKKYGTGLSLRFV